MLEIERPNLVNLQGALHFRTVSNPADEPLCITTLLGLDLQYVVSAQSAQERMSRVWELISRSLGGGVPAAIIFSLDETLAIPGWRWAPSSLLGVRADGLMEISNRLLRFRNLVLDSDAPSSEPNRRWRIGTPTPLGLRIQMPGYVLKPVARLPESSVLCLWDGMVRPREDQVFAKEISTGQWYNISDLYRSRKISRWSDEERFAYDDKVNNPLSRAIQTGNSAIILDPGIDNGGIRHGLLVQAITPDGDAQSAQLQEEPSAKAVRRGPIVAIQKANPTQVLVAETLRQLATRAAETPATRALLEVSGEAKDNPTHKEAVNKAREMMKELMADMWKTNPEFVQAIHDTVGPNTEEYIWARIPMSFQYDIVCEGLPSTQVWFVD